VSLRNLQIYFPKEKFVDRVYGMVDRVHGTGSKGLRILIKRWSSIVGWGAEINPGEGVFHVLILAIDRAMDGSQQLWLAAWRAERRCHGLLLQRDGPAATVSFSRGGLHLRGWREVGTHLGWFLGGGGDQRVVCDGGRLALIFNDGVGLV
jgi:hypothetical protein